MSGTHTWQLPPQAYAGDPPAAPPEPAGASAGAGSNWTLTALGGRLTEISGDTAGAPLTLVFRLALEAQRAGEPLAWIGRRDSAFFPPDVAEAGLDLDALAVIWAPDSLSAARATELLLRSGAFGLLVLDLGSGAQLSIAAQTRLAGLARQHQTALVCVTEKAADRPSLGSLVSLRAQVARTGREKGGTFRCEAHALKDKRRGPGWRHAETCLGPDGLR
jgi:recombination protein RecA